MLTTVTLAAAAAFATPSPADTANIQLAQTIAARVGDRIWPGWSKTPFYIDLLTDHGSALVGFTMPQPPPAFPVNLEATFPLSNGMQTIVIGEPQFTQARTPMRWTVTLLHEHFHQWQYGWPGYLAAVKALDLAPKGGNDAMWMLNYAFPYDDPRVAAAYRVMASDLATAVRNAGSPAFADDVAAYRRARQAFRAVIPAAAYRYFAFQCWQEGVARYTEYTVASLASEEHKFDGSFLSAEQAAQLAADSTRTYDSILRELTVLSLAQDRRINFYSLGAGEALLLDRLQPGWRERYLDPRMDLSVLF